MTRAGARARSLMMAAGMMAAAVAAAAGFAGVAAAQDQDEAVAPPPGAACGRTFASSGTASNVAYAADQLKACDALLASAATAADLNAATETITQAHANVLERWRVVTEELVAAASSPAPAAALAADETDDETAADAADDEAAAAADDETEADPWTSKLAERHAIETAMDGLRILMRLSFELSDTFADPSALAAALQGPAAAHVQEVLAARKVCASAGAPARGDKPARLASWYAYADLVPEGGGDPITYEREVPDDVARLAEAYVTTTLATAPELGVSALASYVQKDECSRREFPSERSES